MKSKHSFEGLAMQLPSHGSERAREREREEGREREREREREKERREGGGHLKWGYTITFCGHTAIAPPLVGPHKLVWGRKTNAFFRGEAFSPYRGLSRIRKYQLLQPYRVIPRVL